MFIYEVCKNVRSVILNVNDMKERDNAQKCQASPSCPAKICFLVVGSNSAVC